MKNRRGLGLLRPIPRRVFLVSVCVYVALRLVLATLPGYVLDITDYKGWALGSGLMGYPAVYENTGADYPPLSVLVFHGVGSFFVATHPTIEPGQIPVSIVPTFLIKIPHLVFDLLVGAFLAWLVGRHGLWGAGHRERGWGRLAASLYWWNPAVLFGSAYWGQLDGMHALFAIAAMAALGFERMGLAGASLAAGGLSKPLAAPLVPLLAVVAAVRGGARGFVVAGLSGVAVAVLVFSPFWFTGRLIPVFQRVVGDVDAMPFTSVNAHNLWWLVGGWQDASAPWLGPLSARDVGIGLFLLIYAVILIRTYPWLRVVREEDYRAGLFVIAAAVISSFFFFSTHMHENHLFLAMPLLIAVAGRSRSLAVLTALCSLTIFFNEILHDPQFPYLLPGSLSEFSDTMNRHIPGQRFTVLQLGGSYVNSIFNGVLWVGLLREVWILGGNSRRDQIPS